jgi:hypothetical protein
MLVLESSYVVHAFLFCHTEKTLGEFDIPTWKYVIAFREILREISFHSQSYRSANYRIMQNCGSAHGRLIRSLE